MEGDSDGNEDGLLNHDPQGSKGFDSLTLRLASPKRSVGEINPP